VERHRVAAEGKQLWPLFAHYYQQVPDGVVNDRWMPWSRCSRDAVVDGAAQASTR
jgi:hypothetical protein